MQQRITTNTFGYNFDTASTPLDKAIRHAVASKASFHTIMVNAHNDFPLPGTANVVWEYYEALKDTVGDLILLVRFYSHREGQWRTYPDRTRWAKALKDIQLPPGCVIDSRANEPELNGSDPQTNKEYVKWEIENLKAVSNAGHRYAVGAFSTGFPHESLIYSVYDDLWRAVDDYNGAIDMHLYGVFPLEAGETHAYDLALNPDAIRQIFNNPQRWHDYYGWLVGRVFQVEQAYEEVNGEKPEILVAESIVDRVMPDPYNSQWKGLFGMPQFQNDNRGLLSWERAMKAVFPELSLSQAVEKFLIHVRENVLYGDNIRMALFGHNPLWNNYNWSTHKWSGHDVSDPSLTDLHEHGLARVNTYPVYSDMEPQPMPETWNPTLYDATVRSVADNINIREGMSTNSAKNGSITQTPVTMKVSKETNNANGYDWYKSDLGYFADLDILRIEYAPVIDPPDTGNETPDIEQAVQDAVKTYMDSLTEAKTIDIPFPNYTYTTTTLNIQFEKHFWRLLHNMSGVILNRLENPTQTLSQIANEIYSTASVEPELEVHTNVSLDIPPGSIDQLLDATTQTDVMMNEDTDNDEQLAS